MFDMSDEPMKVAEASPKTKPKTAAASKMHPAVDTDLLNEAREMLTAPAKLEAIVAAASTLVVGQSQTYAENMTVLANTDFVNFDAGAVDEAKKGAARPLMISGAGVDAVSLFGSQLLAWCESVCA